MKVAIAGASGFIGQLLLQSNPSEEFDWIALGRSVPSAGRRGGEPVWRSCDLFSLPQIEAALEGAEVGIYLVHSMLPRAKLTQSSFEDCDLILADNFARAARKAGLKRIIYLSGLLPGTQKLSRHLESRREVADALASTGVPVTTLRAGLVLGAQGSSFQMMYLLVKRLPVMICPKWTQTRTQCIAASDVVQLIRFCLRDERTRGGSFDIGSPEVLTYQQLMTQLAEELGKRPRFFSVPLFTPGLSRLWIQLITGGSRNLVAPLVQSLKHEMVVHDDTLMRLFGKPMMGIREAMRLSLVGIKPTLRSSTHLRKKQLEGVPEVRSIQRLRLPAGRTAEWVATEYFQWLPRFLWPLVLVAQVDGEVDTWIFKLAFLRTPLLKLWHCRERSTSDCHLFYLRGGLLVKKDQSPHARLEFREVLGHRACLAAIHEYRPSLPWVIYKFTQALLHLLVMARFRRHIERTSKEPSPDARPTFNPPKGAN